jgi:hypothetical protein
LVINHSTAKALGLTIRETLRRRGDPVSAPGKLVRSSRWKTGRKIYMLATCAIPHPARESALPGSA